MRSTGAFSVAAYLRENGRIIAKQPFPLPDLKPLERANMRFSMPHERRAGCEYSLELSVTERSTGYEAARWHFDLSAGEAVMQPNRHPGAPLTVEESDETCLIKGDGFDMELNTRTLSLIHIYTEQSGGLCEPRDIAAQGWVSLEQAGRGAALMSAGGYGYSCAGGLLCLNLIRACEGCSDEGVHEFRYALYLHSGGAADVVRQAALFSQPPIMRPGLTFGPLCWLDAAGVMLDAVKLSEDGGDVVVRMHECAGASARGSLRLGFESSAASVCDLMERATAPLGISDGGVMLDFAPFEIKTVMLTPAGKGGLGE